MDRADLLSALKEKGINESLYSLDGMHSQSESYSIVQENEKYCVYYKERGKASQLAKELTEEEACNYVYSEFKSMFNWQN